LLIFNKLAKKRGFHETLFTLYGAQNYSLSLPEFFERLEEIGSYYNAFFRIKDDLIKYGILVTKKNRYKEKVLGLTKKGVMIAKILRNIDDLLDLSWDDYQSKMKKQKKQQAARERRRAKKLNNSNA
jgi:hypothetical protein